MTWAQVAAHAKGGGVIVRVKGAVDEVLARYGKLTKRSVADDITEYRVTGATDAMPKRARVIHCVFSVFVSNIIGVGVGVNWRVRRAPATKAATTSVAETNLVISTVRGRQFVLLLQSLSASGDQTESAADLLVVCQASGPHFIEESFLSALIPETISSGWNPTSPSVAKRTQSTGVPSVA